MSPLLVTVLISDLPERIREKHDCVLVARCADDIVLSSRIRTDLQVSLDTLRVYCAENGLVINAAKTKVVKFSKGGRTRKCDRLTRPRFS